MLPFPQQFAGAMQPRFPSRIAMPTMPQFASAAPMTTPPMAALRRFPAGFAPTGGFMGAGFPGAPAMPTMPGAPAMPGMPPVPAAPAVPPVPAMGGGMAGGGGLGSSPAQAWANAMGQAPAGITPSMLPNNPFGGGGGASAGGAPMGPTGSVPGTTPGSLSPAPSPGSAVHNVGAPTSSTGTGGAFDQYVSKQNSGSKTFDMTGYRDKLSAWHDELMSSLQTYLDALQGYNPMSSGTRPENPLSSLMEGRPNVRDFWSTPKAKTTSAPTNARTF